MSKVQIQMLNWVSSTKILVQDSQVSKTTYNNFKKKVKICKIK